MEQAFTQDLAAKVAGLSRHQLDYWDRTDVVRPSVAAFEGRGYERLYSFRDLIKLKIAAEMRRTGMSPTRIRRTVLELTKRGFDEPLLTIRWLVEPGGNEVLYLDPTGTTPMSAKAVDQIAEPMDLPLRDIRSGLEASIEEHTHREAGRVVSIRNVQGSEPVLAGTRVPAEKVTGLLARGWTEERILAAFPRLTAADIQAARRFGRRARTARSA
jgi:uncharacterized protein (DUF433 family)